MTAFCKTYIPAALTDQLEKIKVRFLLYRRSTMLLVFAFLIMALFVCFRLMMQLSRRSVVTIIYKWYFHESKSTVLWSMCCMVKWMNRSPQYMKHVLHCLLRASYDNERKANNSIKNAQLIRLTRIVIIIIMMMFNIIPNNHTQNDYYLQIYIYIYVYKYTNIEIYI